MRLAEESARETTKEAEREAKENAEVRKSWDEQLAKETTQIWKNANHAISEDLKGIEIGTAKGVGQADSKSGTAKLEAENAVYAEQEKKIDALTLKIKGLQEAETDPSLVSELQSELDRATELHDAYANKVAINAEKIQQAQIKSFDMISSSLNSHLLSWMQGHETLGRALEHTWMSVASAAVQSFLKIGEAAIADLILHKSLAQEQKLMDAKGAFGTTMKALPFPLNIPLAIASAGAVLAFEQGGVVPETGGILAHKNEMVLPAHISQFIQQAAKNDPAGGANGGGDHFHYAPNISAIDRNGVEDVLKDHSEHLFTIWQSEMRRRNAT
jgi:hypothetical protein